MKSNARVPDVWMAVAAALCVAPAAEANTYTAVLVSVYDTQQSANLDASTATFMYDDVTHRLSQTGGELNLLFQINPSVSLYRVVATGLAIGNSAAAAASTYVCSEGSYGPLVAISFCGRYEFGANSVNDSALSYGPGTAHSLIIGGDDQRLAPSEHSISDYDGLISGVADSDLYLNNARYSWHLTTTLQAAAAGDDGLYVVPPDATSAFAVGANDINFIDPVTITVTTLPTKGTITAISPPGPAAGMFITYLPNVGASGLDTFAYTMTDSVASADSANVTVFINGDVDSDGVLDANDNCTLVANPTQLDADVDGYGNICDADLNNSGTVTTADFGLLRSVLGQVAGANAVAALADMNGSGTVTTADFGLLRARLGTTPGPSGLACAGTQPCLP